MKKFTITTSIFGALAATALGLAQGYNVQLNGSATAPLSQCAVTGTHGDSPGRIDSTQFTTVYVDISCPNN